MRGSLASARASAGKLLGEVVLEAVEADLRDEGAGEFLLLRERHAFFSQAEADVLQNREPREERVALEHHAAVGTGAAHRLAVERDAAGRGRVQARDHAQQGALAAAGGAEDRDEVVLFDGKAGRLQGDRAAGEGLGDLADLEDVHVQCPRRAHGKSARFKALKAKSLTRPITPMTMMPKMIWSVASSAWLSVIMWPMPLDAPISSATIT